MQATHLLALNILITLVNAKGKGGGGKGGGSGGNKLTWIITVVVLGTIFVLLGVYGCWAQRRKAARAKKQNEIAQVENPAPGIPMYAPPVYGQPGWPAPSPGPYNPPAPAAPYYPYQPQIGYYEAGTQAKPQNYQYAPIGQSH